MPLLRGRTLPLFDDPRAAVRVPVRTAVAAAIAATALGLVAAIEPILGRPYYFPAFAGVVLAAVLAGARYGTVATLVFGVGYAYFYLEPRGALGVRRPTEVAALVGYTVTGCLVALIGGALRSAYARLRDQHRALRAIQEQREDLLRSLTHDMRAPLNVISMSASLLARAPADAAGVSRRAQAIQRGVAQVAAMLRDLVDTAHLESGHLALDRRPVDLAAFAAQLREHLAGAVEIERVDFALPPGLPAVHVDPHRFERILVNLLTNALKYAPAASPVVVGAESRGRNVVISVADEGPGIAPEDLPHIFEKYYRAASTRGQEGLGLGLYITRKLVEAHGGRIWADPRDGRGTTFRVEVPAARS